MKKKIRLFRLVVKDMGRIKDLLAVIVLAGAISMFLSVFVVFVIMYL